jgi:hypothetical protein
MSQLRSYGIFNPEILKILNNINNNICFFFFCFYEAIPKFSI